MGNIGEVWLGKLIFNDEFKNMIEVIDCVFVN